MARKLKLVQTTILSEPKLASTLADLLTLAGVTDVGGLSRIRSLNASVGKKSLYNTLFGRDAIRMAIDLFGQHQEIARAIIKALARLQGTRFENRAEEEPGKIIHEQRRSADPVRKVLEHKWSFPYYGSVDSTPQYINLVTHYARHDISILRETYRDRRGRTHSIEHSWFLALSWLERRMRESELGYIEYRRLNPLGILNQVWKDSSNAYLDEHSNLPDYAFPIAAIEVQGYAISALANSAEIAGKLAEYNRGAVRHRYLRRAGLYQAQAEQLRKRVLKDFFVVRSGLWSSALYRDDAGTLTKHDSVLSNPGHLLNSRLFDDETLSVRKKKEALIAQLFTPEMLCLTGLRTRSAKSKAYAPGSYHNGSSWPVDTGVISQGLRRQGYVILARELEYRILLGINEVGKHVEFFRGDSKDRALVNRSEIYDRDGNKIEQVPQENQGWTITRVYKIKQELSDDFVHRRVYKPKDRFESELIRQLQNRGDLKSHNSITRRHR